MSYQRFFQRAAMPALALGAALAVGATLASADEGTVQKKASFSDGYCHLKIPALRPSTWASDSPELKSSTTGDVIDFYGPCDYDAKSKDEIAAQKRYRSSHYAKF
jgi:hypothetical protein